MPAEFWGLEPKEKLEKPGEPPDAGFFPDGALVAPNTPGVVDAVNIEEPGEPPDAGFFPDAALVAPNRTEVADAASTEEPDELPDAGFFPDGALVAPNGPGVVDAANPDGLGAVECCAKSWPPPNRGAAMGGG
jgi:hypothetical protein